MAIPSDIWPDSADIMALRSYVGLFPTLTKDFSGDAHRSLKLYPMVFFNPCYAIFLIQNFNMLDIYSTN